MPTTDRRLHTFTYRIDPASLGELALYPLTPGFRASWDRLASLVRPGANNEFIRPRYSDLATALTVVTGQPVRLFPVRDLSPEQRDAGVESLLVTTVPIEPWLLATAVRTFERKILHDDDVDTLAPHLAAAEPTRTALAEHIGHDGDRVQAPGWIYRVAQWNLAAAIAGQPLVVDGRLPVRLRLDSEANLVAWDAPIEGSWKHETRYGMIYLDTRIVTLPGAAHLYLRLDGHVARVPYSWWRIKNVWVAPRDPKQPVLRLPVRRPRRTAEQAPPTYNGLVTDIVHACQLDPLPAPPEDLTRGLGAVRPIGNPDRHPIGVGPGTRFLFQSQRQIGERLGLPEPDFHLTKISTGQGIKGHIPPEKLDPSILASGAERLRVVCLYGLSEIRRRMADALSAIATAPAESLVGVADDEPVALSERLSVVFHRDPDLIAHGDHVRDLDRLVHLRTDEGHAVVVWAETEWSGDDVERDAKPLLRSELGRRGIVVQFLSSRYKPPRTRRRPDGSTKDPDDHPAQAALRDLLRQAGIVDDRFGEATTGSAVLPLERSATLVGLHLRRHTPSASKDRRLVIQMTALHATPERGDPWSLEMYDDSDGWLPYRRANARYYARDIGHADLDRTWAKAVEVRRYVDQALDALPRAVPLVVFIDAEAGRTFWSGLTHPRFGDGLLPGLPGSHPDVAAVRVASGSQTLRPTHVDRDGAADPDKPPMPGARMYEHEEGGVVTWLLAQPSRTFRSGPEGRAGHEYTRWTLPVQRERWMAKPWHAMGAIEIAVPRSGSWEPATLAALTARLCHQAASWDDRTVLPSPLHLARCSDLDHPGQPLRDDGGQAVSV